MKRILLLVFLVLSVAGSAFAAAPPAARTAPAAGPSAAPAPDKPQAEPAAQPAAASEKPQVQFFDNWEVRCFAVKSASPCDMLFAQVRKGTEQRIVSVSIAYVPSRSVYVMQIAVPYGIALSEGLVIAAGTYRTGKLTFRRCDGTGCFVEMEVGDDLINGLKGATDGNLTVVADRGKPVSFDLPLKGFAAAQQAMVSLAAQKAVAPAPAAAAATAAPAAR